MEIKEINKISDCSRQTIIDAFEIISWIRNENVYLPVMAYRTLLYELKFITKKPIDEVRQILGLMTIKEAKDYFINCFGIDELGSMTIKEEPEDYVINCFEIDELNPTKRV